MVYKYGRHEQFNSGNESGGDEQSSGRQVLRLQKPSKKRQKWLDQTGY